MFTAQGRILLKEKETGTPEEQLRSLASVKLQADIKDEHDKLAKCQELQETIVNGNSVLAPLKTSQNILKLLKAYAQNFKQLQARVDALEEGIHLTTRNLLSDVNRLVINVPVQGQHRRTPVMPHEQDSRKKRKTPGPRRPEDKKGKRGRSMKVQKVAATKQPRKKKKTLPPSRWKEAKREQQQQVPQVPWPLVPVDLDDDEEAAPGRDDASVVVAVAGGGDQPNTNAPFGSVKFEQHTDQGWQPFEPLVAVKKEPVRPPPPPPPYNAMATIDFFMPDE